LSPLPESDLAEQVVTAPAEPANKKGASYWRGVIFFLLLVSLGLLAAAYLYSLRTRATTAGLRAAGQPIGALSAAALGSELHLAIDHFLDSKLQLKIGASVVRVRRREVGFYVDIEELQRRALAVGRSGHPLGDLTDRVRARRGKIELALPLELDRKRALEFLTELKDDVDRGPLDARLDLEHHEIAREKPGYLLRVYDSMVALEYATRSGAEEITLASGETPPRVTAADLKDVDISTVLGHWETHYSASGMDSDRTYNLKVGADHLNGHILKPHEVFSFNEVVGDRTEKEGYRVAPVIQGGELIDGLAGGMCQIASTLHAAAFFAGLDIVSSTPHSRPSAYIAMGLDSTVVYPNVDLKLRNPYDFPVVMHYQVNQGEVKVELLGKERPNRVVFEREIRSETPFGSETRSDPTAPAGQQLTLQEGYPGYALIRRRYIFSKDQIPTGNGSQPLADLLRKQNVKPIAKQQWSLRYPTTTQIIAIGSGPASLKPKPKPPSHHIPAINPRDKPLFKMMR
jgi:vancomycin resistance protein YoaR